MSKQNIEAAKRITKGDVIWVPYRQCPMWPALVQNVYYQKVSYSFFPLAPGDLELKKSKFTCAPKLVYALLPSEPLSKNASKELKEAYAAACEYCSNMGKVRGSLIPSFGEAGVEEKMKDRLNKKVAAKKEKADKKHRNKAKADSVKNEDEPSNKRKASCVERATSSGSHQYSEITEKQSADMIRVINDRLESLIDDIWKTPEVMACQEQIMNTKMTIKLKNNQFLKESDYATVFERIVNFVRTKNESLTLISAFNLTASYIIPHVLINCYSMCKNVEYQVAKDMYHHQNSRVLGLDPSMTIPVTDHLEELCRLACDESDAIQN